MSGARASFKIVLSPSEFEYMQKMLDHGYMMAQAILAIRPDSFKPGTPLEDLVVTVEQPESPLYSFRSV